MSKFTEELVNTALQSPNNALYIAKLLKDKRFLELEQVISTNSECSYCYAKDILKNRFQLGEQAIAQTTDYAYYYAKDILRSRFPLGEQAISQSARCSYEYAKEVLKSRFELGEQAIAKDSMMSYRYAKDVLKERFELGEPAIANNSPISKFYFSQYVKSQNFEEWERCKNTFLGIKFTAIVEESIYNPDYKADTIITYRKIITFYAKSIESLSYKILPEYIGTGMADNIDDSQKPIHYNIINKARATKFISFTDEYGNDISHIPVYFDGYVLSVKRAFGDFGDY